MAVIRLQKTFRSPAARVFGALTEQRQLEQWFTPEVIAMPRQDTYAAFAFGFDMNFKVYILRLEQDKKLVWEYTEGTVDWDGSLISFHLTEQNGKTKLEFVHKGLKNSEKLEKWTASWRDALSRLKNLVEKH